MAPLTLHCSSSETTRCAHKLTLGKNLTIATPHLLQGVPDQWLSNARMTHYQALLHNPARIVFQVPTALNPAMFLLDPDLEAQLHDCSGILAQTHCTCRDLKDTPFPDAEETWLTNGSNFVCNGLRYAGAAVTTTDEIVWAEPMPAGTSTQKAELIAVTKALELGQEKKIKVCTDSHYAFSTTHIQGAIYKERGFLTTEGNTIKNTSEILQETP